MKQVPIFIGAMALALAPLLFVHPVQIQGTSMEPTLHNGGMCFALRSWCAPPPRRGQIWLVRSPEGVVVKRLIALPGQHLSLRDGAFLLDGLPLREPYVAHAESGEAGPWEAGEGYLVLGDNRPASRDGRAWGPLPRKSFEGYILH